MLVYRIATAKYSGDLSGMGASIYGGRWNRKGTPVLYTGESREIALLETLVHTPPLMIPNLDILTLQIPDDSITEITEDNLPESWMKYPAPTVLSDMGENWVRTGITIALKVPSCVISSAHLYVLNCSHPNYNKVKLIERKRFHLDARLIK